MSEYLCDLQEFLSRDGAWSFTVLVSSGALEPEYPTHVHFCIGGKKGDASTGGPGLFVKDSKRYEALYNAVAESVHTRFGLEPDHQVCYDTSGNRIYLRRNRMPNENNVIVRIEWAKILWSLDRILIAKAFAEEIWRAILGKEMPAPPPELKKKQIGFEGYL